MVRVYVGKMSHRSSERDLKRFFDSYGKINEILMKNGFAFVDFEDYKDADDAVYDLNGKELCGDRVIVEIAKGKERGGGGNYTDGSRGGSYGAGRDGGGYGGGYNDSRGGGRPRSSRFGPPMRTKWEVRVENLSSRISWQDLKDMCRKYGEVTYADAHKREMNVATVCFATQDDMKEVIRKLDGKDLNGRKIEFIEQVAKSRSRSRSRSQSKSRRSRSKTPPRKRSRSNSRSRTPVRRNKSPGSRSGSRSPRRSASPKRSRQSNSPKRSRQSSSPKRRQSKTPERDSRQSKARNSRSRSRSGSRN